MAVIAHLGLRPQSVGLLGGYGSKAAPPTRRTEILASALQMEDAGAAAILLEAVPPEVAKAVVDQTRRAGHRMWRRAGVSRVCHRDARWAGSDAPSAAICADAGGLAAAAEGCVRRVRAIASPAADIPAPEHDYVMPPAEKATFVKGLQEEEEPFEELPF